MRFIESFKISEELTEEIESLGDHFDFASSYLIGSHNWSDGFIAHNWRLIFYPQVDEFEDYQVVFEGSPDHEEHPDALPDFDPRGEMYIEVTSNKWEEEKENSLFFNGEEFIWNQDIDPDEQEIAERLARTMWTEFQKVKDKVNAEYLKADCKKIQVADAEAIA